MVLNGSQRKVMAALPPYPNYGAYPANRRYTIDQVPGKVHIQDATLNDIGSGECFLVNAKRDMTGRQCTYQLCVRAEGEQHIPPVLIFKNNKPSKDRWSTQSGVERRQFTFRGETKRECDFYDKRGRVMWQKKAWLGRNCAKSYFHWF